LDPLQIASHHYDFPDPSSKASPTSSIEAEPDFDHDHNESNWDLPGAIFDEIQTFDNDWEHGQYSDSGSSNANPFADPTAQEDKDDYAEIVKDIPIHESKPLDIDL
jgi:ubiquitin carboxyl-terminal hydrolase 4/11